MATDTTPLLYLDNDYDVRVGPLKRKRLDTGAEEIASGLTVIAFLSAAKDVTAAAIHADVQITLTEQGAGTGVYAGTFEGDKLTLRLGALAGTKVYRIIKSAQDFRTAVAFKVVDPRPS